MSDEVERTKCVQRENNASIHQVQLHGRDIKKTSGGGTHLWDGLIFSLSLSLSVTGRDSDITNNNDLDEDMRKIKESKK